MELLGPGLRTFLQRPRTLPNCPTECLNSLIHPPGHYESAYLMATLLKLCPSNFHWKCFRKNSFSFAYLWIFGKYLIIPKMKHFQKCFVNSKMLHKHYSFLKPFVISRLLSPLGSEVPAQVLSLVCSITITRPHQEAHWWTLWVLKPWKKHEVYFPWISDLITDPAECIHSLYHTSLIDLSKDPYHPEGASYKYYEVAIIGAN